MGALGSTTQSINQSLNSISLSLGTNETPAEKYFCLHSETVDRRGFTGGVFLKKSFARSIISFCSLTCAYLELLGFVESEFLLFLREKMSRVPTNRPSKHRTKPSRSTCSTSSGKKSGKSPRRLYSNSATYSTPMPESHDDAESKTNRHLVVRGPLWADRKAVHRSVNFLLEQFTKQFLSEQCTKQFIANVHRPAYSKGFKKRSQQLEPLNLASALVEVPTNKSREDTWSYLVTSTITLLGTI